ncbi:hemerythrin domain-containing protein [Methanobacterium sp.]|uniref:hemerythrin domain-containing protein n=1 Tax=Methanobacterium sp. TaxID=2164 RepID=UPI003C749DB5
MAENNVYEFLKSDHDTIKSLLRETIQNKDPSRFPKIQKEWESHMLGEERYFYPAIRKEETYMVLERYEEHELGKKLIYELDKLDKEDEHWLPKIGVLQEIIELHIGEEEKNIFPKAKEIISEDKERRILDQIRDEKSRYVKSYL